MLKIISIVSFAFALIFLLMLLFALMQRTKKKSQKVRKQILSRRRLYAAAGAIFFLAGFALQLISARGYVLKSFISAASPVDEYKKGSSVEALPDRIYAVGDDYYIHTGKNKIYGHLAITETTTNDKGEETETLSYQNGLCFSKMQAVAGGEGLLATLDLKGNLRLNGAFQYLTYEKDDTSFNQQLFAKNCSFVSANRNSLLYVEGGDLYSAGYNAFGQLGDGTERNRVDSSMILERVASVSTSQTHTLAVDIYGNLYGFGDNSYSEMGNRTTAASGTPIKLMSGVKQAEAGRYFSVILAKNGDVYTAGRNDLGQLGTGDNRDYATYKKVLEGVMKIAVSDHSCAALTADGKLYVWGSNAAGQLGKGAESWNAPQKIAEDVYDVAMGPQSMGVIRLNRDVEVSGAARPEGGAEWHSVYAFGATVPEDQMYSEKVEMPAKE